jgi:menaquinol-cytochrome c reductase iron-sulfur subunit
VAPENAHTDHDLPGPSLWPVGFAVGIAALLVGLVISWIVAAIGAAVAIAFGFLWVRELATGRDAAVETTPEAVEGAPERPTGPALPAPAGGDAMPHGGYGERFPRSTFLEGATLGLGAVIGGIVTVPVVGFAVLPPFLHQGHPEIDLGPVENFPEGQYVVATFMEDPNKGEVSRRTAFVRNNGLKDGSPSYTIISNRCAHLGCPVQPGGPIFDDRKKTVPTDEHEVTLLPTTPAGGFICPCHGGAYDTEGNRTAGPPVRALDRWTFAVKNGRLKLLENYSVGEVQGTGANARITKYDLHGPGQHVDGPEAWFYPVQAPN